MAVLCAASDPHLISLCLMGESDAPGCSQHYPSRGVCLWQHHYHIRPHCDSYQGGRWLRQLHIGSWGIGTR